MLKIVIQKDANLGLTIHKSWKTKSAVVYLFCISKVGLKSSLHENKKSFGACDYIYFSR